MTKEQIKKDFILTIDNMSYKNGMIKLNDDFLELRFKDFYNSLSDIIKINNIKSLYIIRDNNSTSEDEFGATEHFKVSIHTNSLHLTFIYYFHFTKTSDCMKYLFTKNGEFYHVKNEYFENQTQRFTEGII